MLPWSRKKIPTGSLVEGENYSLEEKSFAFRTDHPWVGWQIENGSVAFPENVLVHLKPSITEYNIVRQYWKGWHPNILKRLYFSFVFVVLSLKIKSW